MSHPVLFIGALAISILSAQQAHAASSTPCTPLKNYVDPQSETNLDTFQDGGDIDSDVVVYFNIPGMQISSGYPQVKLCIEDLPIPSSVGGTQCDGGDALGWNNCWLIIATHTGSNLSPEDTQNCQSEDEYRGTAPCYECTCMGSYFGGGSVPDGSYVSDTLKDSCGLSSQHHWGVSCPDVMNGRRIPPFDGVNLSNYSTVQINICDEATDGCSICQGGYQPAFEVGLQWVNDVGQCHGEPKKGAPFTSAAVFPDDDFWLGSSDLDHRSHFHSDLNALKANLST
eukprot:CAMPEP_0172537028 /NCGR_PEP_ID=MMETSP1067-20121228/8726_1 /TAXON_ID=265564 ORGANISM="Thalassiosira punctigera, Strain Tpunct2005C2" /NCGR_SAMPLE_ID=MMETSP1067 /ASSEMBLY_ACC=CAM_ASM_000444 /LENGTH=283 /DNA_ID=CAMNT_0013322251 /DNA_START=93 /DNA_END=943 /DNA_ORIENTATION=-